MAFRDPKSSVEIHYKKVGRDTSVESDVKEDIKVEDKDFVSVFCDDLESLLLHRNTLLDKIEFKVGDGDRDELDLKEDGKEYRREYLYPICEQYYKRMASILRYRVQKLQVKYLKLRITEENQITSILPYIDPNTVTDVNLTLDTSDPTLTLAELWSLDFWRLAKPSVYIHVETLRPDIVIAVKEAFFTNPNLDDVVIYAFESSLRKLKDELNGDIYIPNTDKNILRMEWNNNKVYFTRVKILAEKVNDSREDVEEDEDSRDSASTRKRPIEESIQKLSIETKKRCEVAEDLQAKSDINIMNLLENDVILKKIMEYVPFPDNQILRKVCRNIRQQIDRIKPDPTINYWFFIIEDFNKIEVHIGSRYIWYNAWTVYYAKKGEGCSVKPAYTCRKIKKYKYIGEDFRMWCLKDFEIIMEHQPSAFHFLRIDLCNFDIDIDLIRSSIFPFLEAFEEFFRSRTPLKLKKLVMHTIRKTTTVLQQNEVMKVLPFLDPQILISIELAIGDEDVENPMEVDKISKLSQWLKAKELIMEHCIISTPIQEMNMIHFAKGDITVQNISLGDLRYLKEGFQNNSTLVKFKIAFKECTFQEFRNEDMYQFMGVPHVEANPLLRNQRNIWFYRMPNCDNILHIVHFVGQYITFSGVEPSKVPENAYIQD